MRGKIAHAKIAPTISLMKVLLLAPDSLYFGSRGHVLKELVNGLMKRCEVCVMTIGGANDARTNRVEWVSDGPAPALRIAMKPVHSLNRESGELQFEEADFIRREDILSESSWRRNLQGA